MDTKTLPLAIKGQVMTKEKPRPFFGLVAGRDTLKLTFDFSDDWKPYNKIIELVTIAGPDYEVLQGNEFVIPEVIAKQNVIRVKVYAAVSTKVKFSTNYITIEQR